MIRPGRNKTRHHGGCACGAVRFEISGAPLNASYCHCSDCRRASGAPVSAFVGFASDDVMFEKNTVSAYRNGRATRYFCATCGSPIAYEDSRLPDRLYFMLGVMDEPEAIPPDVHAFHDERLSFLTIDDALPRLPGFSVARPTTD